ncbi:hypothetical protein [Sphingomonas sp. BK235]|uniref:hypothetical protein n=1 Tax=Sphingomonas sp. BK235 TaxID=2512131 RepID=UPI00104993FF|nr:hypothetical protein [Sphingomonas sp. BK235]TCP36532.1 hypothetical protein EV292_10128 [Sphingomonas sp. BK235]
MAAEAQRATRSREQTNSPSSAPHFPAPVGSLAESAANLMAASAPAIEALRALRSLSAGAPHHENQA